MQAVPEPNPSTATSTGKKMPKRRTNAGGYRGGKAGGKPWKEAGGKRWASWNQGSITK